MVRIDYQKNDIVLVKSVAGDAIPPIHVRLLEREIRQPSKGNRIDWPGYSGWMATPIYQKEIEILKKEWSIPFNKANKDLTFVYDKNIIKKIN
tara:strand:- start:42681 stop:42959 length:279 start_codon:yes stop_codon:yes gene_type:complete